jgi:hypothetical protein
MVTLNAAHDDGDGTHDGQRGSLVVSCARSI